MSGADGNEQRQAALDERLSELLIDEERDLDEADTALMLADDTYDGAPWCQYCGALRARDCGCGEIPRMS